MKPILYTLAILLGLYSFSTMTSCNKCKEDCDDDTTGNWAKEHPKSTATTGDITILVKPRSAKDFSNSNNCFAIIGKTKEDMYANTYILKNFKPRLTSPSLDSVSWFIDSAYSIKNSYNKDGVSAGAISFKKLAEGTYWAHVFDGAMRKAVISFTVIKGKNQVIEATTQPLAHLKITVGQSSIAGQELNDIEFRVYGFTNDTFNLVAKANPATVTATPYYSGTTGRIINESGHYDDGIAFLYDVPVYRSYGLIVYNSVLKPNDGTQPWKEILLEERNTLVKIRINFI